MSRNHREPVKPVESEESGEDDDAESEEESDSEPEPTPAQKNAAKPQQTPTPTPQPPPSSSSEEDEESGETESESDEEESKSKPPPSKPVEKSTNGRSKPSASVAATPTKAVASKRAAAEDVSTPKGSKKVKTNNGETPEKKSASFQRVFSEDDDLVILQEMIDFRCERNSDPVTDSDVFYECIKDKLQAVLSNSDQLKSKIKRLRRKFLSNNAKEKTGTLKLLANSRDQKLYELSKLFWENGKENGVEGSQKARRVAKKTPTKKATAAATATEEVKNVRNANNAVAVGVEDVKNLAFFGETKKLSSDDGASMEEIMLKTGRRVYEAGEGIEGEDEWSKLRAEELELYIKQLEVRAAQAKLVLGVIKPQDH